MEWLKAHLVPASYRDYARVGPLLIYRKLWSLLLALLSLIPITAFGFPAAWFSRPDPSPDIPLFRYDAPALATYSGKARIADGSGVIRYAGDVTAGQCTGEAEVFDASGTVVYRGPVVEGRFEGENGSLYDGGVLLYQGGFLNSRYQGEGVLYDRSSGMASVGTFENGAFTGVGKQTLPDGGLLREGVFLNGLLEGEGKEYGETGALLREGTFSRGRLEGAGLEYGEGKLLYEGAFHAALRHGEGTLYNPKTGKIRYSGLFLNGEPNGAGQLFNARGQLYYEGSVYDGQPDLLSFLGARLEDVERCFPVHGLVYSCGTKTAFVWPEEGFAFLTDSPVLYSSQTLGADAQTPDPLAVPAPPENESVSSAPGSSVPGVPGGAASSESAPAEPPAAPASSPSGAETPQKALFAAAAPEGETAAKSAPITDYTFSEANRKKEIVITGVMMAGGRFAGLPEESDFYDAPAGKPSGYREFIAAALLGKESRFTKVTQAGEFIYLLETMGSGEPLHWQYAEEDGVGFILCSMENKNGTVFYSSAEKTPAGSEEP